MDEISKKLSELGATVREPSTVTRLVLEHRLEVEEAMKRGVSVAKIAAVLSVNANTLAGVLRRERFAGKHRRKRSALSGARPSVAPKEISAEAPRNEAFQHRAIPSTLQPRRKLVLDPPTIITTEQTQAPRTVESPDSKY